MAECCKCGKSLGFFSSSRTIRHDTYCYDCARSVPTCDKCKWHYRSDYYPKYGCCAYHSEFLQDYDNVCEAYEKGRQVHPDVMM